jgi:uncharacterized membrane protein YesL
MPRLGAVIRASLSDYYFNSMRLVPANIAWGAGVVLIVVVGLVWPPGALLLLPLLVLPTAVAFRIAALVVRGEPWAGFRDAVRATRAELLPTLGLSVAFVATGLILMTNVLTGVATAEPAGLIVATLAAWGLVAWWCGAIVTWPLIVDPARATRPVRQSLHLAGALLLTHPARFGALGLVVALVVVVSTILTAAILTVSVAFVAVVACRSVYPAADRLEIALAGERS